MRSQMTRTNLRAMHNDLSRRKMSLAKKTKQTESKKYRNHSRSITTTRMRKKITNEL